jgi:hypothetical protein
MITLSSKCSAKTRAARIIESVLRERLKGKSFTSITSKGIPRGLIYTDLTDVQITGMLAFYLMYSSIEVVVDHVVRGLGADNILINDSLVKSTATPLISSRLWQLLFERVLPEDGGPRSESFLSEYGYVEANAEILQVIDAEFKILREHSLQKVQRLCF